VRLCAYVAFVVAYTDWWEKDGIDWTCKEEHHPPREGSHLDANIQAGRQPNNAL